MPDRLPAGPGPGSASRTALLVLALVGAAWLAAPVLVPIAAGVLLQFLLSPLVRRLERWHLPRALAAALPLLAIAAAVSAALYGLSEPAIEWVREAPVVVREFRDKLRGDDNPFADAREATEAVREAVEEITGSDGAGAQVRVAEPDVVDAVIAGVPLAIGSLAVALFLAYLVLISHDTLLRRVTSLGGAFAARRRIVETVTQIENDIGRYLATVTAINAMLGVVVAGAMALLGVPNPVLWGIAAAVLNFAPYAGAAVMTVIMLLVGVSEFEPGAAMLAPAATFLCLTVLEGQLVTPVLLGRRLKMSPVVVFLSVLLVGSLWGVVGALLAVPLVASLRIVSRNVPRLSALGRLLDV